MSVLERLEQALECAERIVTAGGAVTGLLINELWTGPHVGVVGAGSDGVARVLERAGIPEVSWGHDAVTHGPMLCVEAGACGPPSEMIRGAVRGLDAVGVSVVYVNWSWARQGLSVSGTAAGDVSGPVGAALGACLDVGPVYSSVYGQADGSSCFACRYRVGGGSTVDVRVEVVWRSSNVDNVT